MKRKSSRLCPLCSGQKTPGTTTFTADLDFGVVGVRKVPATVCSQCGADWIEDKGALIKAEREIKKNWAVYRERFFTRRP